MKNKIWKEINFVTDTEQRITIQPTPEYDGITLSFCEHDNTHDSGLLYINKNELHFIIEELEQMMEYVKK